MNDPTISLSEGQKSCLRLVGQGMSSKEIAKQTGLTPQTVDTYVKASMARLGASNRRDAARILLSWEDGRSADVSGDGIAVDAAGSVDDSANPAKEGWRRWISLPPIGGGYSDGNWTQKTYQALQVAMVAAATVVALALLIAGILQTFR